MIPLTLKALTRDKNKIAYIEMFKTFLGNREFSPQHNKVEVKLEPPVPDCSSQGPAAEAKSRSLDKKVDEVDLLHGLSGEGSMLMFGPTPIVLLVLTLFCAAGVKLYVRQIKSVRTRVSE